MKKRSFIIAIVLLFTKSLLAVHSKDINPVAEKNFKKEYSNALYASWEQIDKAGIYAVRFIYNNQSVVAYYNERGLKFAEAKLVQQNALPLKVRNRIGSLYKTEEIKSIQELIIYNRTCYFFETEKKGRRKMIGIHSNGHLNRLFSAVE